MNIAEFTNLLKVPQGISQTEADALKTVINAFPYFQSARAMYLKGLKNSDSFKYNNALKISAAYTTDRSVLFDFITSSHFNQNEISKAIKQNTSHINTIEVKAEDISSTKHIVIDSDLKQHLDDAKHTLDTELFQPKIKKETVANFKLNPTEDTIQKSSPEHILSIGKPLLFNKSETHSFNQWLSLAKLKPIERDTKIINTPSKLNTEKKSEASLLREKKFDLIEKFIEKSPKLSGNKAPTASHNIAKAQMIQPEALMTETLARIYLEQKNYKKAIQSYNILSLKYPEKSGFFADRIKAIKQLQEHNNK